MTIERLVGHRFPGGTAVVERWEHALFHHAVGHGDIPRHDHVHEAMAFHVPIRAAGTSISDLFGLVEAEGPVGIGIDHYDFTFGAPWRVDDPLHASGSVVGVEAVAMGEGDGALSADLVTFRFELASIAGASVVASEIAWLVFRPSRPAGGRNVAAAEGSPTGAPVATRTVRGVSPDNMRLAAAIFRDPYPIHWDPDATAAVGLGHRVVNQTPLNVGYVVDLLADRYGQGSIRRLRLRFPGIVFGGDDLVATEHETDDATVAVSLRRSDDVVLHGSAWMRDG